VGGDELLGWPGQHDQAGSELHRCVRGHVPVVPTDLLGLGFWPGQQAPQDRRTHGVECELQRGDDPEVATAAFARPQQVRVLLLVGAELPPVRRDQLDGHQVVAGQPVLAFQPAGSATERQAADARDRYPTPGRRQAVHLRRPVELAPGAAGAHPGSPCHRVDVDRLHRPDVDHEPVVVGRLPGHRVTAGAHGHREPVQSGSVEGESNVRSG
jgi:hypothetical protein